MDTPTIRPYAHEMTERGIRIVVEYAGYTYVVDYDTNHDVPEILRRWTSAAETKDLPTEPLPRGLRKAILAVGGTYPLPDGYTWEQAFGHWRVNPPTKPAGAPVPRETGREW